MKKANANNFESPQFNLFSETQLHDLHLAALEVLRRTGVRFYHEEALDIFKKAGAFVSDGTLVKIPANLVKDAISSAPERIVMCDRGGKPTMFLEGYNCYFGTGSDTLNLLDYETGKRRKFTTTDLINGYRLCDALPNIHFQMSLGIPSDVDAALTYDVQMALMLEHTTKPIVFVTDDKASCQRAIDMAAVVAGGPDALREQQHILLYSQPTAPLEQSPTAVDKLLLMAENQLPIVHSSGPMPGGTGPITVASSIVLGLAETLSSLTLHQLKKRSAPFVFGCGIQHIDMRTGQVVYAAPEFVHTRAAVAELGRWYGMPTWGYASCCDAKIFDEQAAAEATMHVMMSKLMGSNLIHDVGYMESGLAISFELIMLTDELVEMAEHVMKGVEVSDDSMMLSEIDKVGPGGQFVDTDNTLKRYKDYWYPGIFDRKVYSDWLEAGGKTLGECLKEKVREILNNHRPSGLPPDTKEKIQEIIHHASIS